MLVTAANSYAQSCVTLLTRSALSVPTCICLLHVHEGASVTYSITLQQLSIPVLTAICYCHVRRQSHTPLKPQNRSCQDTVIAA